MQTKIEKIITNLEATNAAQAMTMTALKEEIVLWREILNLIQRRR